MVQFGNVMGMPVQQARQTKMGKVARSMATAAGVGYVAGSMKFNAAGSFATTVNGWVNAAKSWMGKNAPEVTKYVKGAYNSVRGYAQNAFNAVKNSNFVKSITNSNIYKSAAEYAKKGFTYVKNSGVGKWVAKNPVAATALAAAAVVGAFVACTSKGEGV